MPSTHPDKSKYDKLIILSYEHNMYGWTENASIILQRLIGPNGTRRGKHKRMSEYSSPWPLFASNALLRWVISKALRLHTASVCTVCCFTIFLACSASRRITHSRVDYTHFARTIDPRPTARKKRKNTISSTSSSPQQRILSGCKVKWKMREELR